VFRGSPRGATNLLEAAHRDFLVNQRVPTRTSPSTTLGNLASNVFRYAIDAPEACAFDLSTACSSSLVAVLLATAWLKAGMGRVCLAGGAESALTAFTLAQLEAVGLLNQQLRPEPYCRPLASEPSSAMVMAEGACALVLERLEDDDPRRLCALAEVVGVGSAVERVPSPTGITLRGEALERAMQTASANSPRDPDAIVVHAPGTARGDRAELTAIRAIFGEKLPALCSNKWQIGHTFGASGALGIDFALALLGGIVPATPPYPTLLSAPASPARSVLVNAAGFGGLAVSILLHAIDRSESHPPPLEYRRLRWRSKGAFELGVEGV
jgi:3-oxoacyl-(acyl-carrier-protein) synthase